MSATVCAKTRCNRPAGYGSRCAKHWLRRLTVYGTLPTAQQWWKAFEPNFTEGLDIRAELNLQDTSRDTLERLFDYWPEWRKNKWSQVVRDIVARADEVSRRKHAGDRISET